MSTQAVSQTEIVRKNTAAVLEMRRKITEARTLGSRIADAITDFTGSMAFVWIHAAWFGFWVLLNVGLIHIPYISQFDPYPFQLLTMVVSLEAIFLSTFVLISQNRLAAASEKHAELDLQVNLLAEQKATKVLEMLDQIAGELDKMSHRFNFKPDPEVNVLKVSPEPQEVLQAIEETVNDKSENVEQVRQAVEEVSDEVEEVNEKVEQTSGQLKAVAEDVDEIKQEVKVMTGEQGRLHLK